MGCREWIGSSLRLCCRVLGRFVNMVSRDRVLLRDRSYYIPQRTEITALATKHCPEAPHFTNADNGCAC